MQLQAVARPGTAQVAIGVLTIATALIHFSRALGDPEIAVLFALNGLGYLLLLALLVLPLPLTAGQRRAVCWVLIGYAALTIALFFVWGAMSGEWPLIGFIDKAIEVLLVIMLWPRARGHVVHEMDLRRSRAMPPGDNTRAEGRPTGPVV